MTTRISPELYKGGRTLSVMPTYACPAQCRDCGTVSSPGDRNSISLETMVSAIDQARDLGFFNVVFTGGEATLRWSDLLAGIRHASGLDFPTRLVTNGHWAVDDGEAERCLEELVEAGLNEINFSTGDEHARFVPVDAVVTGIRAALKHPLNLALMIELRAAGTVTQESFLADPRIASLDDGEKARIRVVESPWMPMKPSVIQRYPDGVAISLANVAAAGGCQSVLQTYVIQADGRIGACCGLGMRVTPELNVGRSRGEHFLKEAVLNAESDLLKLALRYKGPEKLLAWAATKDPDIEWENLYAHKCQACLRIYKDPRVARVVWDCHAELIPGVLQAAWLEEELFPEVAEAVLADGPVGDSDDFLVALE